MTDVSSPSRGPRRRAVRLTAAVAGVLGAMGVAGCGIQPSTMKVVGAAPTLQAANDVTGTEGSGNGANQYALYFFRDGKLTPVMRYTDDTVTEELVLEALIKGPNSTDSSDGYTSDIPSSLQVVSYTAADQQWNYEYSQPLTTAERAEIVCTVEADLTDSSVGTFAKPDENWNNCSDFSEDYGAPAILGSLGSASVTPTDSGD